MMDLLQLFERNFKEKNLFQKDDVLLLAVSGGVDSVVLCELCCLSGLHFIIAHCNFQLREEESDRDERFVQLLSDHYGVRLFVNRFNTADYAVQNNVSVQLAAREQRYEWFEVVRKQLISENNSVVWVVTAHHADDNIETVLMNFFKGTGVLGLRGMLPKTNTIIRPLLFARKQEIIDFAVKKGLNFVEDSSNKSEKYSRNFIRHRIIPSIQDIYPSADDNILANIERFREIEWLYQEAIEGCKKKLVEKRNDEVYIPVLKLLKIRPLKTVLFEILRVYNFSSKQIPDVTKLLNAETGKYVQSSTHRILRNRKWLVISPLHTNGAELILIERAEREVFFEGGKLRFSVEQVNGENLQLPSESNVAWADAKDIKFPMILRKWKEGDYFYPLGMEKKKKLARFFIDQKMSLSEKEKIWVLEMNKKIIWVVNQRIDNRFKVSPNTQSILKISLEMENV